MRDMGKFLLATLAIVTVPTALILLMGAYFKLVKQVMVLQFPCREITEYYTSCALADTLSMIVTIVTVFWLAILIEAVIDNR
jgi:hypothetical protein